MRIALAWLAGTALFAAGVVLADRWLWSQCGGLPASRWAEVWICANMFSVRIAMACLGGVAAGAIARRRALALGALVGLAGVAAVTLAYRPLVPFMPLQGLLSGVASFVVPAMGAAFLASLLRRRKAS